MLLRVASWKRHLGCLSADSREVQPRALGPLPRRNIFCSGVKGIGALANPVR